MGIIISIFAVTIIGTIISLVFGKRMSPQTNKKLGWVFIGALSVIAVISIADIIIFEKTPAEDLIIDADYKDKNTHYWAHNLHIEGDYFYKTHDTTSNGHYFYHPASVIIDGEKYYTYTVLNDGARTNYLENNKYSPNNSENWKTRKVIPWYDKKIDKLFRQWCEDNDIDEDETLSFGI